MMKAVCACQDDDWGNIQLKDVSSIIIYS